MGTRLAARVNAYAWFVVLATVLDLLNTWRPFKPDWLPAVVFWQNPSWFHIGLFFVVTPLFAAWVTGLFRHRTWARFIEIVAFTIFLGIAEDWLYIAVYSIVVKQWMFPWYYTWMLGAYWPWVYQWFGQNWWLDLPTGYYWGIIAAVLLAGMASMLRRTAWRLKR